MTLRRVSRIAVTSAPLLLAILIVKLWRTGTLTYYINDRTVWIVLLGAVLSGLVGVVTIRSALRSTGDEGPSWQSLVFLSVVVLGLIVQPRPLSAVTGQASSLGALQLASHVSSGDPGDQFGTWIHSVSAHPDPQWWGGKRVTLVGFASRQSGLPAHSFIIARFLVTCCVVDASLLGFPVQIAQGSLPPDGAWVQVTGKFGRSFWTAPGSTSYPLIQQARVTAASVPASPYLSP